MTGRFLWDSFTSKGPHLTTRLIAPLSDLEATGSFRVSDWNGPRLSTRRTLGDSNLTP